jgi:hypothetical protein
MKPIYDAWLIQIDITNVCSNKCSHCTRAVPHFKNPYFAEMTFLEQALQSLRGWKRGVGCIGGEPTLHPEFETICLLYRKYFPKKQCGIFTSGGPLYEKHKDLINKTFGMIHYHNHKTPSYHQPIMIAAEDIISDETLRSELIRDCWLQRKWCPSITIKGCFFCEVAATFDLLFNGPGGYSLEPGWWKKNEADFSDQVKRYCRFCSVPIPIGSFPDTNPFDYVSQGNAERLIKAQSPLAARNGVRIFNKVMTREKIKELLKNPAHRDPSHCGQRDQINYFRKSPLILKINANNVKHEILHCLKTGDLRGFLHTLKSWSLH